MGSVSDLPHTPGGLPLLERGGHRSPEQGACLMEYVSVLAGTRFSDRPRCTHPALAALARLVNDHLVDPGARSRLVRFAPDLIGTATRDPRVTPTVVACCLRAAVAIRPDGRSVQRQLQRVEARLTRLGRSPWARRWARWDIFCGDAVWSVASAFRLALDHTADFAKTDHDQQLHDLLGQAITECRRLRDEPSCSSAPRSRASTVRG